MNLETYTENVKFDCSEAGRIKILDSDGEYINYFTDDEDGTALADALAQKIRLANSTIQVALCIYDAFSEIVSMFVNPDNEMIKTIYERYGSEFINRIGDCYLVTKE